jgi:predicted glycoside hydrolase/deacetylase ChbG (UPF0249 family)
VTILVLCADDFGLTEGVSRGVLRLAAAGRVSAVSCMVAGPRWNEDVALLRPLKPWCDIGLHLTLTDLVPLGGMPKLTPEGTPPSLTRLARLALLGHLDRPEIADELDRQLARFEAALGRPPDFIDGHRHVHVLPVVRDAVLDLFDADRLDRRATYVRNCFEPFPAAARRGVAAGKAFLLSALARRLAGELAARQIPANDSFRGINAFVPGSPVRPLFQRFFRGPGTRPLVMCHPGLRDPGQNDEIARRRPEEQAYLESEALFEDLEDAGATLGRFPR